MLKHCIVMVDSEDGDKFKCYYINDRKSRPRVLFRQRILKSGYPFGLIEDKILSCSLRGYEIVFDQGNRLIFPMCDLDERRPWIIV